MRSILANLVIITTCSTLLGCGTFKSYEEREIEALASGDWSEIERIDKRRAKKQAFDDLAETCANYGTNSSQYMVYCETRGRRARIEDCGCADRGRVMDSIFGR
jgi:hypothetical protein